MNTQAWMAVLLLILTRPAGLPHETTIVRDQVVPQLFPEAKIEHRLWDGTRVDILTDELAIEVDWAEKWAEAVGQSVYYAELTNRQPAIVLITDDPKRDERFIYRGQIVATRLRIRLFVFRIQVDN